MRTLPLPAPRTCPGHSQNGVLLQLILSLRTAGHRRPLWLWLLLLSALCRFTWAHGDDDVQYVEDCLKNLTHSIQRSDATLYAPSVDEIKENCEKWSLSCYMEELEMVLIEEQIKMSDDTKCIADFKNGFKPDIGSCPPCEATALRSSTTFLDNLKSLLKKLTSLSAM